MYPKVDEIQDSQGTLVRLEKTDSNNFIVLQCV